MPGPTAGPVGVSWLRALLRAPRPVSAGVASVVVSFFLCMYYNMVNAWAFWYLFHSFQVSGHGQQQEGWAAGPGGRG